MIYALVQTGVVTNVIVAEPSDLPAIADDYDEIVDVTEMTQRPGPSWFYEAGQFVPPPEPEPEPEPTPAPEE